MKSLSFFWSTRSYHAVCVWVGGGGGGCVRVWECGDVKKSCAKGRTIYKMQTIRSARKLQYTDVHETQTIRSARKLQYTVLSSSAN